MNLRKPRLSTGWYFRNQEQISGFLGEFAPPKTLFGGNSGRAGVIAAVSPHASWYYSGALAAQAAAALAAGSAPDTIAVIGGHLSRGMPILIATEDAMETPLGDMEIDKELAEAFIDNCRELPAFKAAEDYSQDNTVEVLVPMVRYFFPKARLLWLRFPAEPASFQTGRILAQSAASLGRKLRVLGSTDLTHYGHKFDFTPMGTGRKALDWVKDTNDRRFIDAVEAGDADAVLERAERESSACSAGAVLGVMGYAGAVRKDNRAQGELLAYATSADIENNGNNNKNEETIPDSFVGYGSFLWK
jgi:AmmeMemoRadiSam system protein B